tara:strand:+ start:1183 stop:1491 length:309 start_codon:yes stop_codon:yes gene_type:complete
VCWTHSGFIFAHEEDEEDDNEEEDEEDDNNKEDDDKDRRETSTLASHLTQSAPLAIAERNAALSASNAWTGFIAFPAVGKPSIFLRFLLATREPSSKTSSAK